MDYERMWKDLKAELEAEAEGRPVRKEAGWPKPVTTIEWERNERADAMLQRMTQKETLALVGVGNGR